MLQQSNIWITSFLLFFTSLLKANEVEYLTVTGHRGPKKLIHELERLDLEDSLIYFPSAAISSSSELEHLPSLRSPILRGGAAAGSIQVMIEKIPFRSVSYGNTNAFLGAPYELLESRVYPGPHPEDGNSVHGMVNYPSILSEQGRAIGVMSDFNSRNRILINDTNTQRSFNIMLDHSDGWRSGSSHRQIKSHNHFRVPLTKTIELETLLTFYHLEQNSAGYIYGKKAYKNRDLIKQNEQNNGYRKAKGLFIVNRFHHNSFDLSLITRHHEMDFNMHWFPGRAREENQHQSLGIKIESLLFSSSSQELSVDSYIDYTSGKLKETQDHPSVGPFIQGDHYDYQTKSFYTTSHLSYKKRWFHSFQSQIGTRFTTITHDYSNNIDSGEFGRYRRLKDRKDRYQFISPYIILGYNLRPNHSIDLSLKNSGRPPEVNDIYRQIVAQENERVPHEKVNSVGLKYHFSSGNMDIEKTAFYMHKKNFYFRDSNADNVIGETRHYGIEGKITNKIHPFHIGFFWNYAHHEYHFERGQHQGGRQISKGQRIEAAPRLRLSSFLSYHINDQSNLTLRSHFEGQSYIDTSNEHIYDGHTLVDLSYHKKIKDLSFSLTVRNLFNTSYAQRADYFQEEYRYFPGRPRAAYLNVQYHF